MDLIPSTLTNCTLESYLIKVTPRSQIIYWTILVMVILGIGVLPFVYVDITVQARGYFQSNIEKQAVYSPYQGKVIFTSMKNGLIIEKGDTLLIIESESSTAQKRTLQKRILENNQAISDLEKLTLLDTGLHSIDVRDFHTKRYSAEFLKIKNSIEIQSQKYRKSETEHERNIILHDQDLIADTEFENSLFIYQTEEKNLNQILIYNMSLWQADLMQRTNDAATLQAELEGCLEQLRDRIILAPVSGEIIRSSEIQEGAIIGSNQQVAEISPSGEMVAICFISPDKIGLINSGQKVRIQVDAFNYNEWGLLDASIINISDDIIVENGENAYFRIKCKPVKTFLSLKTGVIAKIRKGMSLNARIIVNRRSLFNLLFDKVDKWVSPYFNDKG
jgi:membrane fusion protein, peptide pheromone/bacteriocin exporter